MTLPTIFKNPLNRLFEIRPSARAETRLRAFLHDSIPYYLLPNGVHDAAALIQFIHAHEFDSPCPLPTPLPADRAVCRRAGAFHAVPDIGPVVAAYCRGETPDMDAELFADAAAAGLPLMPMGAESELIERHYVLPPTESLPPLPLHEELRSHPRPPAVPPTTRRPRAPDFPAGTPKGVVMAISPEVQDALAKREKARRAHRSWPFKTMDAGQMVVLPAEDAYHGQRAAHAHAVRSGRTYRTFRTVDNSLAVVRLK